LLRSRRRVEVLMRSSGLPPGVIVRRGQELGEGRPANSANGLLRPHHCLGCCVNASTSTPSAWLRIAAVSASSSIFVADAANVRRHTAML